MHGEASHPRRRFTGETCSLRQTAVTRAAAHAAIVFAQGCLAEGRLLTPAEAMAVTLAAGRECETLFSIARRFSADEAVDLNDVLCDLGERFPDYA